MVAHLFYSRNGVSATEVFRSNGDWNAWVLYRPPQRGNAYQEHVKPEHFTPRHINGVCDTVEGKAALYCILSAGDQINVARVAFKCRIDGLDRTRSNMNHPWLKVRHLTGDSTLTRAIPCYLYYEYVRATTNHAYKAETMRN
jgi:hypothetical protein